MSEKPKQAIRFIVLAAMCAALAGCAASPGRRYNTPGYRFLKDKPYASLRPDRLYVGYPQLSARGDCLAAFITVPAGELIEFSGPRGYMKPLPIQSDKPVYFRNDTLYPFRVLLADGETVDMTGAVMVVNVDESLSLASFGKSEDTKIFAPDLIDQVRNGVLGKGVLKFENRPVLFYWLGNRRKPLMPGAATIELDFSGIPGLAELRVKGRRVRSMTPELRVYQAYRRLQKISEGRYRHVWAYKPTSYPFEMRLSDGERLRGYIKVLKANEMTTFLRIPCVIPPKLIEVAKQGSLAKYTVTTGKDEQAVAQLIFSRAR